MQNQTKQIVSQEESVDYSDSDGEMFLNLAPSNQKKSSQNSNNQQHSILAKMKRLIGDAYLNKTTQNNGKSSKVQKSKTNNKNKVKMFNPQSDSYEENINDNVQKVERQRSRDKFENKRINKTFEEDSEQKINTTAILLIQKQNIKQNLKSAINQLDNSNVKDLKDVQKIPSKINKFAQIEKQLLIPIDELPVFQKSIEEQKEEKRAKKRLDRMMEKKYKEYKVGKVKDQTSNCVFNGIEDYFM